MPELRDKISDRQQKAVNKLLIEIKALVTAREQARAAFGEQSKEAHKIQKEIRKLAADTVKITHEKQNFAAKIIEASNEHLRDASMTVGSELKGHFDEVLGDIKTDVIDPIFNITKSIGGFASTLFKRDDKGEAEEAMEATISTAENMKDYTDKALHPGSIFTHDIHSEALLEDLGPEIAGALNLGPLVNPLDLLAGTVPLTNKMQDDMFLMRVGLVDQKGFFERLFIGIQIFWNKWFVKTARDSEKTVHRLTDIRGLIAKSLKLSEEIAFEGDKSRRWVAKTLLAPFMALRLIGRGTAKGVQLLGKDYRKMLILKKKEMKLKNQERKAMLRQWKEKKDDWWQNFKDNFLIVTGLAIGIITAYTKQLWGIFKPAITAVGKIQKMLTGVVNFLNNTRLIQMLRGSKSFGMLGKLFDVVKSWGTQGLQFIKTLEKTSKFFRLGLKFGRIIGKALLPIQMAYKIIEGLFKGETILDKIKLASAGILSTITAIPEMILNGIFWLFGSKTRVDFGSDAIAGFADKLSDLFYKYFVNPVFSFFDNLFIGVKGLFGSTDTTGIVLTIYDFFMKGILESITGIGEILGSIWEGAKSMLSGAVSFMTDPIVDALTGFIKSIGKWVVSMIPGGRFLSSLVGKMFGGDDEELQAGIVPQKPPPEKLTFGERVEVPTMEGFETGALGGLITKTGLVNVHKGEIIGPISNLENDVLASIRTAETALNTAKIQSRGGTQEAMADVGTAMKKVGTVITNSQENQSRTLSAITTTMSKETQGGDVDTAPPDEIENFGMLLFNKSWGMS